MSRHTASAATVLVACVLAACAQGNNAASTSEEKLDATPKKAACPKFTTGHVQKMYCQVALQAVLSDPDRFSNERVFTYGYVIADEAGVVTLVADPSFREIPDAISCIGIKRPLLDNDEKLSGLRPNEFYSVELGGVFYRSGPGMCVGTLSEVEISAVASGRRNPALPKVW